MIPVAPPDEPANFDETCRKPGAKWLADHPDEDPHRHPLWRAHLPTLREAFAGRCGFLAMKIPKGTVDHWTTIKNARALAYEWSNYRFVDAAVNCAKKPSWDGRLLDPYEVRDGWFEILLPSLQLVVGEIPDPATRERAEFTLKALGLRDGEDVLRLRQEWLEMYELGELTLDGLRRVAPLLARAVDAREAAARDAKHEEST